MVLDIIHQNIREDVDYKKISEGVIGNVYIPGQLKIKGRNVLIAILALTQTGIMIPLAVTAGYAVLSIRLDDTSIKQFIVNAWKYCVGVQQYYEWRYTDE